MFNRRQSRGVATVELTLLVPILVFTVFLGVEAGRLIQARTLLVNGLHNSLLRGLHMLYADKSLWGRNNDKEYVIDGSVLDAMESVLEGYVGNHELLSPTRDYKCQCVPPATSSNGKVDCDDPKIVACPDISTQIYLTYSSGINFKPALGGTIPIGPLKEVIRVK